MFDFNTRVLVVDDKMAMRRFVAKACREIGFTDVTEAHDGQSAWEAIRNAERPVGFVISDCNMPNGTGLDLLRQLRSDDRFNDVLFLLLAAENEGQQVAEALRSGADAYVVRPFTAELLRVKLASARSRAARVNTRHGPQFIPSGFNAQISKE